MSHVEPHPEDPDKVILYDTDSDGIVNWESGIECPNQDGAFDHLLIEPPIREER